MNQCFLSPYTLGDIKDPWSMSFSSFLFPLARNPSSHNTDCCISSLNARSSSRQMVPLI